MECDGIVLLEPLNVSVNVKITLFLNIIWKRNWIGIDKTQTAFECDEWVVSNYPLSAAFQNFGKK